MIPYSTESRNFISEEDIMCSVRSFGFLVIFSLLSYSSVFAITDKTIIAHQSDGCNEIIPSHNKGKYICNHKSKYSTISAWTEEGDISFYEEGVEYAVRAKFRKFLSRIKPDCVKLTTKKLLRTKISYIGGSKDDGKIVTFWNDELDAPKWIAYNDPEDPEETLLIVPKD